MPIRLPFRRVCTRHHTPIKSNATGDRETIRCEEGHSCHSWLVVDAEDNWVGIGHRERTPKSKKLRIPHRPCLYGHMNWKEFIDQNGKTRYRCKTCQTQTFRKLKKKGLVNRIGR